MDSVIYEKSQLLVVVQNSYFPKVLLINSISPLSNLLNKFFFGHLWLLEDYGKSVLYKSSRSLLFTV